MGIDNIMNFEWVSSSFAANMIKAFEFLYAFRVLDDDVKFMSLFGVYLVEILFEL